MTNAAINLGIGGIAGWRILQRTEASQVQAIAQDPVVQRSTAYFRENTASGITAEDLVGNYRLLSVALLAGALAGTDNFEDALAVVDQALQVATTLGARARAAQVREGLRHRRDTR